VVTLNIRALAYRSYKTAPSHLDRRVKRSLDDTCAWVRVLWAV